MKSIIFTCMLVLGALLSNAQNWEPLAINNHFTISFPGKPYKTTQNNLTSFICKSADSTFNIIATITDMKALLGVSVDDLAAEMDKDETWEQAKQTFVSSMGANAKLINSSFIEIAGLKTLKIEIERPSNSGITNKITSFVFVYGVNSYNLIFVNRGGKADAKLLNEFLAAVQLTK